MRRLAGVVVLFSLLTTLPAAESQLAQELRLVVGQGRGTPAGRAAWEKIVRGGPPMTPPLLEAMNPSDIVAGNWLRTAFDRIVEGAATKDPFDRDALMAFVKTPANQGRARR